MGRVPAGRRVFFYVAASTSADSPAEEPRERHEPVSSCVQRARPPGDGTGGSRRPRSPGRADALRGARHQHRQRLRVHGRVRDGLRGAGHRPVRPAAPQPQAPRRRRAGQPDAHRGVLRGDHRRARSAVTPGGAGVWETVYNTIRPGSGRSTPSTRPRRRAGTSDARATTTSDGSGCSTASIRPSVRASGCGAASGRQWARPRLSASVRWRAASGSWDGDGRRSSRPPRAHDVGGEPT